MKQRLIEIGLLLSILGVGAFFRFYNLNWDSGAHLHPDERFLTMVGNAMSLPHSWNEYFNPHLSPLNPTNVGFEFFVYGVWPLTMNKLIALPLKNDTYGNYTLQGRFLSGFFDLITLLTVFFIARLLAKKLRLPHQISFLSALAYALMVLPIQLSHFFATDTFLTTFLMLTLLFGLQSAFKPSYMTTFFSSVFFGMALATKLNAAYLLPLLVFLFFYPWITRPTRNAAGRFFISLILLGIGSYVSLRLTNPYTFEHTSWLNPTINQQFLKNLKSLESLSGRDVWFPPAVQWINKTPVLYAAKNLSVLGIGMIQIVWLLIGLTVFFWLPKTKKWWLVAYILGWVGVIFLYQSVQFVKALRYFIFLYPLLAFFVGLGMAKALEKLTLKLVLFPIMILLLFIWPLMFLSIYIRDNSRIQASQWICDSLPNQSVLATEHWDDGLPVGGVDCANMTFSYQELPVFGADTDEKWQQIETALNHSDYYVLSSNRGWGSMPTVPERYPKMTAFYHDLLAGNLFVKVADFSSYPSLSYLGIPLTLPDDWADETFTVYDHPRVLIYKLK